MESELDVLSVPRVTPIGLLERPVSSPAAASIHFTRLQRALALALLALFATVTVATTVVSFGAYCLTTEPGDVRPLPKPHSLTISRSSISKTRVPAGAPLAPL